MLVKQSNIQRANSLQLESEFTELEDYKKRNQCSESLSRKRGKERRKLPDKALDRHDECGICMENCTKMVLLNCEHSLYVNCFHDWKVQSQFCPFCRGSLKRVGSKDLWVHISNVDIIDMVSIAKENLRHFCLYVENLPLIIPETHPFIHDYML